MKCLNALFVAIHFIIPDLLLDLDEDFWFVSALHTNNWHTSAICIINCIDFLWNLNPTIEEIWEEEILGECNQNKSQYKFYGEGGCC